MTQKEQQMYDMQHPLPKTLVDYGFGLVEPITEFSDEVKALSQREMKVNHDEMPVSMAFGEYIY